MYHYRVCTIQVFDVLDTTMVSATIYTHPGTPGVDPPIRNVISTVTKRADVDDDTIWLWNAVQELQARLDQG